MMTLLTITKQFAIPEVSDPTPYGNGHINDTYYAKAVNAGDPAIILQRLNTRVFPRPDEVMSNIVRVTEFLSEKIRAADGDPKEGTLTVVKTKDGQDFYRDGDDCYRVYLFIEDSVTHEVPTPALLLESGRAFGRFQGMLSDFPAETLFTAIPDFHNTPVRLKSFETAVTENKAGRLGSVLPEVEKARYFARYANLIMRAMEEGTVPARVTHNDTKLNNILFHKDGTAGAVIDLDTVMPGSCLFDFGDALRFGASTAAEDERDLSRVHFDLSCFRAFAEGFLSESRNCLTEKEIALLPISALILTYECGIRFLADDLNGDTYFKVHRERHNLDRARTQLRLCEEIEEKLPEMQAIVAEILSR